MSNVIKGFRGTDGPILLDYLGVANVPGAVQSIADLTAKPGDYFEVATVDAAGKVATVKAVAMPGGGDSSSAEPWTTAALTQLLGILNKGIYRDAATAENEIEILEAMLLSAGTDKTGVVQVGSNLYVYDPDGASQDSSNLHVT